MRRHRNAIDVLMCGVGALLIINDSKVRLAIPSCGHSAWLVCVRGTWRRVRIPTVLYQASQDSSPGSEEA